jgi:hypothetical protein
MAIKKSNRGGKRIGAGRKPASYKTVTISFRVRAEWAEQIKELVNDAVSELQQNSS